MTMLGDQLNPHQASVWLLLALVMLTIIDTGPQLLLLARPVFNRRSFRCSTDNAESLRSVCGPKAFP